MPDVSSSSTLQLLLLRAELGVAGAQYKVGRRYETGHSVKRSLKKAAFWYQKAAEAGHRDACFRLAKLAEMRGEILINSTSAAQWYQEAASLGHIVAAFNVGLNYLTGNGVSTNPREAAIWFHRAAAKGHAGGQFELGKCYANGEGVAKDLSQGIHWFAQAEGAGHLLAGRRLAMMYYFGIEVPRDTSKAITFLLRLASRRNGNSEAQRLLAETQLEGGIEIVDKSLAEKWLRDVARHGDILACYMLGKLQLTADTRVPDLVEAEFYLKRVADDFMVWLRISSLEKTINQNARDFFSVALSKIEYAKLLAVVADAPFLLGRLNQFHLRTPNYTASANWYRIATEHGHRVASYALGWCYEFGCGVPQNYAKAVALFRAAAERGNVDAEVRLGRL
jgi:TPR repeat protein